MTPAERALLLAVARYELEIPGSGMALRDAISAVEVEAVFAAEDETELAEVAAKARVREADDDISRPYEEAVCPTCKGVGWIPWAKHPCGEETYRCPDCDDIGRKEKT